MKIPNEIQIAGKIVQIKIDNKTAINDGFIGKCYADENLIVLADYKEGNFSKSVIQQTLIHECLHFCNRILGYTGEPNAESYVNPLSEFLLQIFQQLEEK